ncbi:unnamed protein product [Acanthoscelides obtectus]|uniref:HTH psq-type domain-containing protein n=1 Tax=Acanthoscelides obtectus TaxID=200917 RepID=A0A9P0P4B4_ACAOB|nr:unnamed protein product [Acanthoscelides obtectus]CAK1669975.1 hypothetical protein AOBTE_LOCUS27334 [Acanthoscelides obtectus]
MPRRKVIVSRKLSAKKRKTWDVDHMKRAVRAVREKKMGALKAAKTFGVSRTTVQRLAKMDHLSVEEAVQIKLGRGTVLTPELEEPLVRYILVMESKFYGFTRKDVKQVDFLAAEIEKGKEHCTAENDFAESTPGTSQSDLEPPSLDNVPPGPCVPTLKKKTTNRGRKASQAAVITSSPYKDELLLSIANKTKHEIKSVKKKVFSQSTKNTSSITSKENKKQRSLGESESDDDETELVLADDDLDMDDMPGQKEPDDLDAKCIFCESRFSEDRKGEL